MLTATMPLAVYGIAGKDPATEELDTPKAHVHYGMVGGVGTHPADHNLGKPGSSHASFLATLAGDTSLPERNSKFLVTTHFVQRVMVGEACQEHFAECLEGYASLAAVQAQPERAARLWGAAEALRETLGAPLAVDERADYEQHVALMSDALAQAAFIAAWAAGRSMTLEQVMAYAVEDS